MIVALLVSLCGPTSCSDHEVASWSGPDAAVYCGMVLEQLPQDRERWCEHVPQYED